MNLFSDNSRYTTREIGLLSEYLNCKVDYNDLLKFVKDFDSAYRPFNNSYHVSSDEVYSFFQREYPSILEKRRIRGAVELFNAVADWYERNHKTRL